ncbi:MAG: hypothetical protein HKN26_11880 [Acidimicrobiales bacterium]|nr:hypothetical protein [Acidimicrobiales bacterium]
MGAMAHPDDEFHPPATDDPYWTETCWFTFTVPERKLSGQLYPFFRPNQGVTSGGAYFWDAEPAPYGNSQPWNIRYGKNFWHLPIPDQPLSDIALANGIRYRCLEDQSVYQIGYVDPDPTDGQAPDIEVELLFTAVAAPNYLSGSHLDQPGRYTGTIALEGETIVVDSFGFRDRSWGVRPQFGLGLAGSPAMRGGYSYATASERDGWHAITMSFSDGLSDAESECIGIHGDVVRDGTWAKLAAGRRTVLERCADTGAPTHVALDITDELGRELHAEGRGHNKLGVHLNPNLFTWNCLTEWTFDGITAWGEDHDNWSATAARRFFRRV